MGFELLKSGRRQRRDWNAKRRWRLGEGLEQLHSLIASGFGVLEFAHDRNGDNCQNDQLGGGDEVAHNYLEILEEKKRVRTIAFLDSRTYGIDELVERCRSMQSAPVRVSSNIWCFRSH